MTAIASHGHRTTRPHRARRGAPPDESRSADVVHPAEPDLVGDRPDGPGRAASAGPVIAAIGLLFGLAIAAAFVGRQLVEILAGVISAG